MKDRHGNEVAVGDKVRVLEICEDFLQSLPAEERRHIISMLGNEYVIDDFPEPGKASVSTEWDYADGSRGYGGLYMLGHEFELVRRS